MPRLVLALLMAFSCMSVIGNAELDFGQVKWDNIDDAPGLTNVFKHKSVMQVSV